MEDRKWLRSEDSLLFRGPLAPVKWVANRKRLKQEELGQNALHEKAPFERFIRHFD